MVLELMTLRLRGTRSTDWGSQGPRTVLDFMVKIQKEKRKKCFQQPVRLSEYNLQRRQEYLAYNSVTIFLSLSGYCHWGPAFTGSPQFLYHPDEIRV